MLSTIIVRPFVLVTFNYNYPPHEQVPFHSFIYFHLATRDPLVREAFWALSCVHVDHLAPFIKHVKLNVSIWHICDP